ncbi:hypothetical protein EW026_g4642 [Hermanssonia centrifuga]|uniref:Uncharacterized protein n=1 Tax=Hermanssonia centrifuga TaxID=98765 RepID=A0A4S4KGS8_9APHY|nr:hypothetical protein EW026_g4642 [Hermanssonia centrifuga]
MNLKSLIALSSVITCAVAQHLSITSPGPDTVFFSGAGGVILVELQEPESPTDFVQVSVVIAVSQCSSVDLGNLCGDPSQWPLSTVLFNGAFDPQPSPVPGGGLIQDFAVDLPDLEAGTIAISVAHVVNVGLKIDQRVFLTPSRRKLDVNIVQSNFHLEITPSEVGNYDRVVIQELLKEIAQTQQVDINARHRFKVVIINEADSLTRDAQAALRRTMEKYMSNMRIILCANSTTPTEDEVCVI